MKGKLLLTPSAQHEKQFRKAAERRKQKLVQLFEVMVDWLPAIELLEDYALIQGERIKNMRMRKK